MLSIDQYAYSNKLKSVHPVEKFALSLLTLTMCLVSKSWLLHFIVIAFMSFLIIFAAQIPKKSYLKLMLVPFAFLSVGVLGIAVTVTKEGGMINHGFQMGNWIIGLTQQGMDQAMETFFRAYASVSCLYFLTLTTPMIDIIWILKRMKVPAILIEMMTLVYRFIFVLLETASMMYLSQECRLGYSSIRKSYHSLGQLISNLFVKSLHRSEELVIALSARGYKGDLDVLEEEYAYSIKNMTSIFILEIFLVGLAILV
ncbi:MAG: cobalt ECF transporter T component CbiQ [Thermotaleaceae bacterium]